MSIHYTKSSNLSKFSFLHRYVMQNVASFLDIIYFWYESLAKVAATITVMVNHYHIVDLLCTWKNFLYITYVFFLTFSVQWTPCLESKNVGGKLKIRAYLWKFR